MQFQIAPPKSTAGNRTIPLTEAMHALLEEQRHVQIKQKETALNKGLGRPTSNLVFATPHNKSKDRNNLKHTLQQSLDKAGLPHIGFHALRHTFATNAVQAEMDLHTLSEIIGYSQIAFTLQNYVHSDIETKRKALEAMEVAL